MCGLAFSSDIEYQDQFLQEFEKLQHRGPDKTMTSVIPEVGIFAFHRLSIMDLSANGDQPFSDTSSGVTLVCNGEIYNYKSLKKENSHYHFKSGSDCEVLLPLLASKNIEKVCDELDGEFAFIAYNSKTSQLVAARDPMGIRPLFYGESIHSGKVMFASEAKSLHNLCQNIRPFPPGHYFINGEVKPYLQLWKTESVINREIPRVTERIKSLLEEAVIKRLDSDAPLGALLSGGLDSSLVCAIAQKQLTRPLRTFSVGIIDGPIDTLYAKEVADFIGSEHYEYLFSKNEVIESVEDVIYHLESYDITTVRASIGMFLICKFVKKQTDIKVLLTGEVSDELFGYKYTDYAPSAVEFQAESEKRIRELYLYDVLRADRCISAHSLEARVPFSDKAFVKFIMQLNPEQKMNTYNMGKYLLRKAFECEQNYLPESILYREKAAFSDAVGHSMVDYLKEYAEQHYTDDNLVMARKKYKICPPHTKEALWYREIFEKFYPDRGDLIGSFWLPNQNWENCKVDDPSARELPNYGKSGE